MPDYIVAKKTIKPEKRGSFLWFISQVHPSHLIFYFLFLFCCSFTYNAFAIFSALFHTFSEDIFLIKTHIMYKFNTVFRRWKGGTQETVQNTGYVDLLTAYSLVVDGLKGCCNQSKFVLPKLSVSQFLSYLTFSLGE